LWKTSGQFTALSGQRYYRA